MKSCLIYFLFFIVFITSSCSSFIQFPVRYLPEIPINEGNKTFVVINDFDIAELNLQKPKEAEVYNSGVKNLIRGLLDSISENDDFKFVVCDSLIKIKADSIYSSDSLPDYKEFICKEHYASNLLVINNFEIFFVHSDQYDDPGEDKVTSRDFSLGVRAGFQLYKSNGTLIESSNVEELKFHKSRPVLTKWITIDPSVKKASETVDIVSFSVGRKYRGKFYPRIENVDRPYYSGKEFKEVKHIIVKGNWENAKDALLLMTKSNDPKVSQEKVAHNLSVVYEALGDFESSKYWHSKSGSKKMYDFSLNNYNNQN